jgi:amidophosphoribosyltransferase
LASIKTLDEIVEFLNVDSLEYLTIENLKTAIDAPGAGFCDACLTGIYPVPVPVPVELSVRSPLGAVATGTPA